MADENYRELEEEQAATGVVDAGDFEDNAGTGMIAEDQEAAAAETQPQQPGAVETAPVDEEQNIPPMPSAPEQTQPAPVDLHEKEPSGLDAAVIVVVLLIIIAGAAFAVWSSQQQPAQQTVAQQQAAQQMNIASSEPPFEVAELPEGVAVVVNGEEIPESQIDEYVADFRKLYDLTDDDAWAEWLVASGYTPESIRNATISMFVDDTLVAQAVDQLDVQVSEEQVDEIYNATRSSFETEEEWEQALKDAGMTDAAFREQCQTQAEQRALMELLADSSYPAEEIDAQTLEYIQTYYQDYADAESLDDIDASVVDPVREMMEVYAQQEAYTSYLDDAVEISTIEMSEAPKDMPYSVNLLPYYFSSLFSQAQAGQQQQQ